MINNDEFTNNELQKANAILELCEKLGLIKLTEISVELGKRFEDYLDYLDKHESLSVKDLDQKTMGRVIVGYLKKNHEAERELTKWMDSERLMDNENGFNAVYTDLNIISEYMSEMLEDLELDHNTMPDEVFEKWRTGVALCRAFPECSCSAAVHSASCCSMF